MSSRPALVTDVQPVHTCTEKGWERIMCKSPVRAVGESYAVLVSHNVVPLRICRNLSGVDGSDQCSTGERPALHS